MSDPIPVVLFCPACGVQHVDDGPWATRPHSTHRCVACPHEWRPSTVGVMEDEAATLKQLLRDARSEILDLRHRLNRPPLPFAAGVSRETVAAHEITQQAILALQRQLQQKDDV